MTPCPNSALSRPSRTPPPPLRAPPPVDRVTAGARPDGGLRRARPQMDQRSTPSTLRPILRGPVPGCWRDESWMPGQYRKVRQSSVTSVTASHVASLRPSGRDAYAGQASQRHHERHGRHPPGSAEEMTSLCALPGLPLASSAPDPHRYTAGIQKRKKRPTEAKEDIFGEGTTIGGGRSCPTMALLCTSGLLVRAAFCQRWPMPVTP